jgi:acyl-CoA thioester hydrolase
VVRLPHTYTTSFVVRHDECDAYGHVNNAMYLRYMQESAFRASADAGFDSRAYAERSLVWLIRETTINYRQPSTALDELEIETWIEGVRRVLARRVYRIRKKNTQGAIADGHSDWVLLDRSTRQPVSIPTDLLQAFFPEGAPPSDLRRERFPDPPAPPRGVFTIQRPVDWRDIDPMHHLTNAGYLSYAEDCAVQLTQAYGWPMSRWTEAQIAIVARRNRIEYRQPVLLEDTLEISTWLTDVRPASVRRYYAFHRMGEAQPHARLYTDWIAIDLGSGRPARIPAAFLVALADNIAR